MCCCLADFGVGMDGWMDGWVGYYLAYLPGFLAIVWLRIDGDGGFLDKVVMNAAI